MAGAKAALSSVGCRYRFPIIVILGSTGVGKTKLSIELAKCLNGEIVSADSMQLYKGLDIITAKATLEERGQCKHHLIDIIDPLENFTVVKFRDMALPIIEDISKRGKLPIIVGGTNYYIESILWNTLVTENAPDCKHNSKRELDLVDVVKKETDEIVPKEEDIPPNQGISEHNERRSTEMSTCSNTAEMEARSYYEQLKSIDPVAASKVHPNDTRKVKRQLDIKRLTGRLPSEVIFEQQSKEGADHLGGPLRFKNALVFWLTCEQIALEKRLSDRVDNMLTNGLLEEISNFYTKYNAQFSKMQPGFVPYTEGIFQAIGFKEFHKYLTNKLMNEDEKHKCLQEGIEALKRVTIRYSKKQKTWVRNRFLKRPIHSSPYVYELDASRIEKWDETALLPALKAAKKFLLGEKIELESVVRIPKDPEEDAHRHYKCETCGNKLIVGDSVWKKHCESKRHKKRVAYKRKLESLGGNQDHRVWHAKKSLQDCHVEIGIIPK